MQPGSRFASLAFSILITTPALMAFDLSGIQESDFMPLFNGTDFNDWDMKFSGHEYNVNPESTIKVDDGTIFIDHHADHDKVGIGHTSYRKRPFSHYLLRVEYQFTDESGWAKGYPSYTKQNSGILYHTQDLSKMSKGGTWPTSVEVQLINWDDRETASWCRINTRSSRDGKLMKGHCIGAEKSSSTKDFGADWIRVEVLVLGSEHVKHIVEGDTVMAYDDIVYDSNKEPLGEGYIALQAEGQSLRFRNIGVVELLGCTDATKANYRPWHYKEKTPSDCSTVALLDFRRSQSQGMGAGRIIRGLGILPGDPMGIFNLQGQRLDVRLLMPKP